MARRPDPGRERDPRELTPYLRHPAYAYSGLAMLLLLLFWWDPVVGTHRLLPSLVLIALAALGTEVLRRQVIREFPDRVTSGSPAGVAQGIAERMRGAREQRVATAGAPAAAIGADPKIAELERLAGLRDSGALTEAQLGPRKRGSSALASWAVS